MEILISVLAYLLHCFTAFALIYSHDKAKIWENEDESKRFSPNAFNLNKSEIQHISELQSYEINDYIRNTICPKYHHFILLREITHYQTDCDEGFKTGFFLQLFSLLLSAQILIKIEIFDSWIIPILLSAAVCSISCGIIYWIYKNYWRCDGIRMKHFSGEYIMKGGYIGGQYEYLCAIKDTVIFRYCVRKILYNASFIIYFLFFFHIPEY